MKLSDLIIESGPWMGGADARTSVLGVEITAADLNELREELIAARTPASDDVGDLRVAKIAATKALKDLRVAREVGERFQVSVVAGYVDGELVLDHVRCPAFWEARYDEPVKLAEVNRRAGEHAEVCG